MKILIVAIGAWLLSLCAAGAQNTLRLPELDQQLQAYQNHLIEKAAGDRRPAIDLFRQIRDAMLAGKAAVALDTLEVLAGRNNGQGEGGSRTWLRLALAWQAQTVGSTNETPPAAALVSAYGAYLRATNDGDRIEALSLLGNMLMRSARLNDSPDNAPQVPDILGKDARVENFELIRRLAYQVFAKLAELVPGSRPNLQRLQPAPFRLARLTYPPPPRPGLSKGEDRCQKLLADKPPGDSANPPPPDQVAAECDDNPGGYVCLVFSRNLDTRAEEVMKNITLERVARSGRREPVGAPPVSILGNSVCYANLAFGAKYRFTLKSTLSSADGTPVSGPLTAVLDTPKRYGSLGFRRGAYVLPAKGPARIALKTVNVTRADLMLGRIGDRGLVREIVTRHIIGGVPQRDACFLWNEVTEHIAEGSLDLLPGANEETNYVVPVGAILKQRRDWLPLSMQQGAGRDFSEVDSQSKLSLKLKFRGDQAAAEKPSATPAGVFVLFGKVAGEPDDDSSSNPECPKGMASQWFVITNIGLTLQRSPSMLYVLARELDTGAPIAGAKIEFLSKSGLVLESSVTDPSGMAKISARLGRGTGGNTLAAVMAYRSEDDFAFLDMTADAIDLTDRGLEGTSRSGEYDAFIAPSRDVFRPGETIEALVLVRRSDGTAVSALPPVEMSLVRSDGSILKKAEFNNLNTDFTRAGGFLISMDIPKSTAEGSLTLTATISGNLAGSVPIGVQYYKPLTVRVSSTPEAWSGSVDAHGKLQLTGTARADYLYGLANQPSLDGSPSGTDAPAANLRGELQVRVEPAQSPVNACFQGYTFGRQIEEAKAQIFQGTTLPTDKEGKLSINFPQEGVFYSNVPVHARVLLTLLDVNGKAGQGRFDVPLAQLGRRWLGIKALEPPAPNLPFKFDFVLLDDKNQPLHERIWVTISREQTDFVWSKDGSSWEYKPVPPARIVVAPRFAPSVTQPATAVAGGCPTPSTFEYKFEQSGRYLVEITDDNNTTTTQLFVGSGWTTAPDGSVKPDGLRVWTQRQESFAPGDQIKIDIETPHEAGRVFLEFVSSGMVRGTAEVPIERLSTGSGGRASTTVRVGDWPPGPMHIYATSFRQAKDDSFEGGPGRAIGGVKIQIGQSARHASAAITPAPARLYSWQLHDATPVRIPVVVDGLSPNAWVTLAIVDEGILSITDFKTPNPYDHFFGKRRLDFDVFDNYGRVLYGKYGFDRELGPVRGTGYQPDDVIIWHSDIKQLVNSRAEIEVDSSRFPRTFQGQLRLMVWAWDANGVTHTEAPVVVRDPVIVRLIRPRFMAPGDTTLLPLRILNPANQMIDRVDLDVTVSDGLQFVDGLTGASASQPCGGGGSANCRRFSLNARMGPLPTTAFIPVQAKADAGDTEPVVELSYRLLDRDMKTAWKIPVRTPYPGIVQVISQGTIAPGETRTVGKGDLDRLLGQTFALESLRLTTRISRNDLMIPPPPIALDDAKIYQLEQIASLIQLLVVSGDSNAAGSQPADRDARAARLNRLVSDIIALQRPGGDFENAAKPSDARGVAPERGASSLDATAFVLDVLSRASAAGFDVAPEIIDRTVGYLLSSFQGFSLDANAKCERQHIYALTVLARLNRIGPATFRDIAASCAQVIAGDPGKKVMLAAAYGTFGLIDQVNTVLSDAPVLTLPALGESPAEVYRTGALLLESNLPQIDPALILQKMGLQQDVHSESLVTLSWLARAVNAAMSALDKRQAAFDRNTVSVTPDQLVAQVTREGLELKRTTYSEFPQAGIRIANRGDTPLHLSLVAEGVPQKLEDARSAGFSIALRRLGVDANSAAAFKQFEVAYFSVEINQSDNYAGSQRLAAVQLLPTGFEGFETSFQDTWKNAIGDSINRQALSTQEYAEFQDDRWITLPLPGERRESHLLVFSVRPTFTGEFVLPPLLVRDLNNPDRVAWTKAQKIVVAPAQ